VNKNNRLIQLDQELLEDYVQSLGVEVIKKMLALYHQQVAIYLIDIEKSLHSNSAELWQEHCHKMKGAAGSIGLKSVHAQLALMEKTSADITEKAHQLAELKDHNKQSLADFTTWLEQI
jgi:HPt (histidine-containing phosphotransfer) domain-containing protein